MVGTDAAIVIDVASGELKRWVMPPELDGSWLEPFISPDGSEVWCVDNSKKTVHRFAMP